MAVAAIAPNWLGDLVMSTDAVRLLETSLGAEPLHVYAPEHLAGLAELILPADEVIAFRLRRGLARLGDRAALARRMRARGYRMAVLFPNSLSTALVARMSGAAERVGTPMHSRAWLLTKTVDPPREGEHEGDAYLRVAAAAAGIEDPVPPAGPAKGGAVRIPEGALAEAKGEARGLLLREGLDPDRERFLVVAPGAAYGPAKQYGAAGFALLARDSVAKGLRPVIIGARADAGAAGEVARRAAEMKPVDLAGKTDLRDLAGVFALASGFVGNDSGAAHLAAAFGIPTVVLFLSTNPVRTAPRGRRVRVLAAGVECRPCMRRTCPRGTYECRGSVTPKDIVRALDGLGAFG
jgi:heptosyltransferase-2